MDSGGCKVRAIKMRIDRTLSQLTVLSSAGPNVGSYYHEKFLRGKHFLTKYIRLKEKGRKRGKPKQSSLQEPNLTLYPQLPQTRAETRAVTSSQRITAVSDRAGRSDESAGASIPLNNAYPHNEHILSGSRRQQNLDDLINSLQLLSSAEKEAAFLPSCSSLLLLQEEERRLRLASLALQNRPLQGGLSLGTPIDVSSLQLLDRLQQSRSSDFSALASAQLARAMTTPSMTEHPELMASVPPSLGISSALDSTSHSRDLIAALRSRREPPTRFFGLDPMLLGGTSTLPLHSTSNNMSLHRLTAGESSNSAIGEFLRGDILSRERQSQIGVEAKRSSSTSDDDEDEDTKPAAVRS